MRIRFTKLMLAATVGLATSAMIAGAASAQNKPMDMSPSQTNSGPSQMSHAKMHELKQIDVPGRPVPKTKGERQYDARATRALNLLMAGGYTDFQNFHQQGDDFAATVVQNGKTQTVLVDPDNGKIETSAS
ncbi:MAG TPA: hypothetical protein VF194_18745 [Ferrovibrio sp.]|uniref:hypothetical protein n=1 Tax=Ferrovibrio sp. TaxID=1917215 RepID=UPI002ED5F603